MTHSTTRTLLSVAVMLTVAPIVAVTALVCWNPDSWGGSVNPVHILVMSFFGLITVPLWPTYLPAVALVPLLMRWIAAHRAFTALPIPLLLTLSLLVGAVAGVCVLGYVVLPLWKDSIELALNWAFAGAVSGALTLSLISLIYRLHRT